jgi:hypothetical protein
VTDETKAPATPSAPTGATEGSIVAEKAPLELESLKASIRSTRFTLIISCLTTAVVIFGFVIDQYRYVQTQKQEEINKRVMRMTQITSEVSELYGLTVTTLRRNHRQAFFVAEGFTRLDRELQRIRPSNPEIQAALNELDPIRKSLTGQFASFQAWAPEAVLAEKWNGKKQFFSPDFDALFGSEVSAEWQLLTKLAYDAFEERFETSFSTEKSVRVSITKFSDQGDKLLLQLRTATDKLRSK